MKRHYLLKGGKWQTIDWETILKTYAQQKTPVGNTKIAPSN